MMRRLLYSLSVALAASALLTPAAKAAFGLHDFDLTTTAKDGSALLQAGAHPFAVTFSFGINHTGKSSEAVVEGKVRDVIVEQMRGFTGDATAVPPCSTAEFLGGDCSLDSVIGIQTAAVLNADFLRPPGPIYMLTPPPGAAARIGWQVESVPIVIDIGLEEPPSYAQILAGEGDYDLLASTRGINQTVAVFRAVGQLWGVPADPAHDHMRGNCALFAESPDGKSFAASESGPSCPAGSLPKPFLTLPRACAGPLATSYEATSWLGDLDSGSVLSHDGDVPPNPRGFNSCGSLGFSPTIGSRPSTDSAGSASGLDFSIDFKDEGLKNPEGRGGSEMKELRVTLPEGMTLNPSAAEGLGVCEPADLDRETLSSSPGQGCPNSSKIGNLSVRTPIIDETIEGPVFLAQQDDPATGAQGAENPFDSLIAFYIVLRNRDLGILVKQPAKVEPDPRTGRLITTVTDIPQLPVGRIDFHFREGQRAPLITPSACGTYTTTAGFIPWARPGEAVPSTADFQITRGAGGGACPPGGVPPFGPGFEAGSLNNAAKAYSPFYMRLTRQDGEQDMTKFSAVLPPGVVGKLAGMAKCPDAAIAAAAAKSGRGEIALPSCPTGSLVGHTLAGAGVGGALTFVPGSLYLAGPYKGDPLSVVAITPAVAGPFDAGTVVVRVALTINPDTAEVEADGSASDPIPHILKGIPLKVRDLRVFVDRPEFILNPTSCDEERTRATLFGSNLDIFSPADDLPVGLSARYQAANCSRLPFRPAVSLRLRGGTGRGAHPALHAVLRARPRDANVSEIVATLPRSAFLDQGHIRTICTRVQFAAEPGNGAHCPKGARYGFAKVFTPLLDEPLEGPVFLRSSSHKLPDLVLALHGIVDINVSARIDSHGGGIRTNFETLPDAPFSKGVLSLPGGRKGLIVNSRDLCARASRASIRFAGQNGKESAIHPPLRPSCAG